MSIQPNPYPLRVDKCVMDKFKVLAKYNARSVNKEIEILMREAVEKYESIHGVIQISELSE